MTERLPADHRAREAALDPARSFIVQAPAGSGKTELLTRRFLGLLALADQPEEVLAITFTRKAAGEMRDRILEALAMAGSDTPPEDGHRRRTWELARAARARDLAMQWDLEASPRRLRVETIDALNAWLARQLPVSSGVGTAPAPAEDPQPAYRAAARRVLKAAGTDHPAAEPARALLAHLGNRFDQAEALLVELLARRDHWLRRVVGRTASGEDERALLETAVRHFVQQELRRVRDALPVEACAELGALAPGAAARAGDPGPLAPLQTLAGFPDAEAAALPAWKALAEMLLTKAGKWRKTVGPAQGFGKDAADDKARMLAVLGALAEREDLADEMQRVRRLPEAEYGPERWAILSHLLTLLPLGAAELGLEFAARGETDFVGVAQAALDAVGTPEAPTDLALALDYRIRHLLVDEFQDTSQAQVDLLERLTAGWEPGDGRTLFCVGDPMQSIYRFREADVGRFLKARRDGVGQVALEPLRLSVNFRSRSGLVGWVNETFGPVFPDQEDLQLGAVPFSASEPWRVPGPVPAVTCTAVAKNDRKGEAAAVAARVGQIRSEAPGARIAVLVRGRPHLSDIGPALARAGVRYQAVDVQSLASSPVVQDLLALTRALAHRGDRAAWLAVLRAPWCGVTLPTLTTLAGGDARADVWARVTDAGVRALIDPPEAERVERFASAIGPVLRMRGRRPLRQLVHAAWLALGGGATARSPTDLVDADRFFEFLEAHEAGGDLDDPAALEALATDLYAAPDVEAGDTVQLMTVHKAKGLEFDHVLLPGLDRGIGGEQGRLLRWLEQVGPDGPELIFAPVEPIGEDKDALHAALRDLESRRDALERDRLLYVAATRAREQLHLFAAVDEDDEETGMPPEPRKTTPLGRLWPAVADAFLRARPPVAPADAPAEAAGRQSLRRLVAGWRPPPPARAPDWAAEPPAEPEGRAGVEYDWAGRSGRSVGIAVHRVLEVIAREGPDAWPEARVEKARNLVRVLLAEAGVPPGQLDTLAAQSLEAVRATLADPRGRWILDPGHEAACSERRVSGYHEGRLVAGIVDRSFVDNEGTLWIVDFKAGRHEGAGLDAFLDREQERYRSQLERYAALLAPLHGGPVRVGLYFPRHACWRDWAPGAGGPA